METSGSNSEMYRTSSSGGSSNYTRYGIPSNFIQVPLTALLEYSGILRNFSSSSTSPETESLINASVSSSALQASQNPATRQEVSIRIISADEHQHQHVRETNAGDTSAQLIATTLSAAAAAAGGVRNQNGAVEVESSTPVVNSASSSTEGESAIGVGVNNNTNRDSSYQRYDIQVFARWIEQILPFSLLLLVVFIRQHLQGFFITIWIAAVMFKSNDILRKQTALKGERKIYILLGITAVFVLHVICVYWWYENDDLLYPLVLLPPKTIPPFWHAIFIIMVNDTMVRQAAMVIKCILLMYYKNSRGRDCRKQGQILTLVEYMLLLYRALLPTPVWYRFFLNKEYGSLFSSLTTGLYLTFKLTSVVEKVQSFFAALRALSRKEVHYGSYATLEQVNAAGDLCAICQEKMHAPILLRCKHIFCEDCVSEWFERERTCPLCRALVRPADIKSFGDGSTSLFFQLF